LGEVAGASMRAPINVNPMQLDVMDDDSIEHAYLTIAQRFGKLDILVHIHQPILHLESEFNIAWDCIRKT
jgi:NAD(P)-dependent dehydrogenase (short-subunit alcohol dehydrogenase family)